MLVVAQVTWSWTSTGRVFWGRLMLMWCRCSSPSQSTSTWTWSCAGATHCPRIPTAARTPQEASAPPRTLPLPPRPPRHRTPTTQSQTEEPSPGRLLRYLPWPTEDATTTILILTSTTTTSLTSPTKTGPTPLCYSRSWWACPWWKAPEASASPSRTVPWAKRWRWSWMLSGAAACWRATSSRRSTGRTSRRWATPRWWTSSKTCPWAARSTCWCSEEVSRQEMWKRACNIN